VRARAALFLAVLGLVVHLVHHLQEGRSVGARARAAGVVGNDHSDLSVGRLRARAALAGGLWELTCGLLTLQLALGTSAVGGLDTLVVAIQLLAHRAALGLGGLAGGVALGGLADGLALGAAVLLAQLLGTSDGAHGLGAVDGALGAGHLLTLHLALGARAHWVAHGRAGGVITLPLALGVALFSLGLGQLPLSSSYQQTRRPNLEKLTREKIATKPQTRKIASAPPQQPQQPQHQQQAKSSESESDRSHPKSTTLFLFLLISSRNDDDDENFFFLLV